MQYMLEVIAIKSYKLLLKNSEGILCSSSYFTLLLLCSDFTADNGFAFRFVIHSSLPA